MTSISKLRMAVSAVGNKRTKTQTIIPQTRTHNHIKRFLNQHTLGDLRFLLGNLVIFTQSPILNPNPKFLKFQNINKNLLLFILSVEPLQLANDVVVSFSWACECEAN